MYCRTKVALFSHVNEGVIGDLFHPREETINIMTFICGRDISCSNSLLDWNGFMLQISRLLHIISTLSSLVYDLRNNRFQIDTMHYLRSGELA